jgi:hypothetical protein
MIIIENESLKTIISQINAELIDFEDYSKLRIISKNKPNVVIILAESDLTGTLAEYVKKPDFDINIDNLEIETTTFDYIVLTVVMEGNKYILKNIPLFELIIASENLLTDNTGIHLMNKSDKSSFNLESKEWNLIGIE